jgi:hypothetical protein
MSSNKTVDWVFEPSPASGARTGGNVAEYAFRPDLTANYQAANSE